MFQKGNTYGDVNLKEQRIGEIKYNNDGELMKIIEYIDRDHIVVEFLQYPYIKKSTYSQFKRGCIKNPYFPKFYGVGYIGETEANESNGVHFQSYNIWKSILKRCYDEKNYIQHPCYEKCTVCDEWLCYKNFKEWYESHKYYLPKGEMLHIDKDILIKHNTVYSPNNCMLVPRHINEMFKLNTNCGIRKQYNGKYYVQSNHHYIGTFDTIEQANIANNLYKNYYLQSELNKYEEYLPSAILGLLRNYRFDCEVKL